MAHVDVPQDLERALSHSGVYAQEEGFKKRSKIWYGHSFLRQVNLASSKGTFSYLIQTRGWGERTPTQREQTRSRARQRTRCGNRFKSTAFLD